jgi:RNA ligase
MITIETLYRYESEGLLYKSVHPTLPLIIWNYTPKVQYELLWDDVTLSCRGLITDINGNIVGRPFKKFFNLEENRHTPTDKFDVYEKMDGSLGILINYNYEWILATRGSFSSDQAIKGCEILNRNENYKKLNPNVTWLFEIIYPENRIVVNYGYEDLVMIGGVYTNTGLEIDIHSDEHVSNLGINIVKKYDGIEDYTKIKSMISDNQEGHIIRFSNGERIKIKGEEYIRLHKIMTEVSTKSIWESLMNNDDINALLENVPDEFYSKIKDYENSLKSEYNSIESTVKNIYETYINSLNGEYIEQYEYAKWVLSQPKHIHPILFNMKLGKEYSDIIWKIIKPEYKKL